MKQVYIRYLLSLSIIFIFIVIPKGQQQIEPLDRGVIAVKKGASIYIGWRLLTSDPKDIAFNVYRRETRLNAEPISNSTNFLDIEGTVNDSYKIAPVIDASEQKASDPVNPWPLNYHPILLNIPAGGVSPDNVSYIYSANDASVGDLDGDGIYELILKWDPSNSHDNAHVGYTGNVILDAYKLDGTRLWRIDLGINIRAGAHYTQFMVYDLDGDGKAEIACKTAPGTRDGAGNFLQTGPAADANHAADYRNSAGRILSGPEYFTVFNGQTGVEMATVYYNPRRHPDTENPTGSQLNAVWGDDYGNRCDRFLACIAYLDGIRPSVVMCRGYYTRTVLVAWDWRDGELIQRWIFDSNIGYSSYAGQGNHNISVADVDSDGKDEIIYGSCAIDDNGTGLWTTGLGHGDAMHVSDIDPDRPGLEKWGITESDNTSGSQLLDARTGEIIWSTPPGDVGRGTAANLVERFWGMECWGGTDGLRSCRNIRAGNTPSSTNHVIWWNGKLTRELLDGITIRTYEGEVLLNANGCERNNGTKANPCLQVDMLGDWREEVIFRKADNSELRLYTTTDTTRYRMPTLMHDHVYRMGIAWQNVAYNQPPHTGFYVGEGMFIPDSLRPPSPPFGLSAVCWSDTVALEWDPNVESDLAGYHIYRARQMDGDYIKVNAQLVIEPNFTDTDVINDTVYYYAVTAVDMDNNESNYSDVIMAIPTIRPDPPIGLTTRSENNAVKLLWHTTGRSTISGFNVYRANTSGGDYRLYTDAPVTESSFIDYPISNNRTRYYVVTSIDSAGIESFYSEEIAGTPGNSFTMQSEDADFTGTVYVENNHTGYHGTGFTNFETSNSAVVFTDLPGFGGGQCILRFRYALGNTDRTGALTVNGEARNLTMKGTGEWTNYVLDSTIISLDEGFVNTVRFETSGSDFGNLDEITLYSYKLIAVESSEKQIPLSYRLHRNYPNPFNPETIIAFELPEACRVTINIYDINGRLVQWLTDRDYQAGRYQVRFNGNDFASGVYLVRSTMTASKQSHVFTRKILLLK